VIARIWRGAVRTEDAADWESMASVRAFAGDDPSRAVYYPEDDRFLIERGAIVDHYDVD